jgi:hypothetical protein
VPHRSAQAVGPGVAAADHDHVLVLRADVVPVLKLGIQQAFGVGVQKLHREMDALQFPAGNRQIARPGRSGAEDDGVEIVVSCFAEMSLPISVLVTNFTPLGQQFHPAFDDPLFELHVGNAVHQQAADAVGPLEDGHRVPRLIELGGGRPVPPVPNRRPPRFFRCGSWAAWL